MNWRENKNFILLGAVFFFFILGFVINDPFLWLEENYESSPPLLKSVAIDDIKSIEVKNGENPKKFNKTTNGWVVLSKEGTPLKAENAKVAEILETLVAIKRYQMVGSFDKEKDEYKLGENELAVSLLDSSGKEMGTVQIGISASGYSNTLVREKGDSKIYSAKGNLRSDWSQEINYYRDRRLFNLVAQNISKIQWSGKQNQSIQKEKDSWKLTYRNKTVEANISGVEAITADLASLQGSKFLEKTSNRIIAKMKIGLQGNMEKTLTIYAGNDNEKYNVTSSDLEQPLEISKAKIDALLKSPEELTKKETNPN